jgi:uncharacterized Ntn-hydrolase superfamily protein
MPRPHGTYSIVALDPATGELGVAVQSHWFGVGALCPWVRPGLGAVATQSMVEPAHGPNTLDRLAEGLDATSALAAVLVGDEVPAMRQVGVVDSTGRVAAHTGDRCIAEAGHVLGEHWACQANMMARTTVPAAMSATFAGADGDLAARLLAALEAAEAEGGDVRGRQSAALVVAPASGEPWRTRVSLRVEDHTDPIAELRRLLTLQRAYELAGAADDLAGAGRTDEAAALYRQAATLAPESDELLFWAGLALAHDGDLTGAADAIRRAAAGHPGWLTLLDRLAPDIAPAAAAVRAVLESDRLKKSAHDVDDQPPAS